MSALQKELAEAKSNVAFLLQRDRDVVASSGVSKDESGKPSELSQTKLVPLRVKIATDFTDKPVASHGEFSGEAFGEQILRPMIFESVRSGRHICIDFDGGYGYTTGFLFEAYGGLQQSFPTWDLSSFFIFVSETELGLPDRVRGIMKFVYDRYNK